MNEKFNKNAKVKQLTKMLGRGCPPCRYTSSGEAIYINLNFCRFRYVVFKKLYAFLKYKLGPIGGINCPSNTFKLLVTLVTFAVSGKVERL